MAKLADAADLKSAGLNRSWGFKSPSGHHKINNLNAFQLIAHARPDIAVGVSTGGCLRDFVMALQEARKRRSLTVAMLGINGGEIARRGIADFPIIVRSDYLPRIQEERASAYHVLLEAIEVLSHADA